MKNWNDFRTVDSDPRHRLKKGGWFPFLLLLVLFAAAGAVVGFYLFFRVAGEAGEWPGDRWLLGFLIAGAVAGAGWAAKQWFRPDAFEPPKEE